MIYEMSKDMRKAILKAFRNGDDYGKRLLCKRCVRNRLYVADDDDSAVIESRLKSAINAKNALRMEGTSCADDSSCFDSESLTQPFSDYLSKRRNQWWSHEAGRAVTVQCLLQPFLLSINISQ